MGSCLVFQTSQMEAVKLMYCCFLGWAALDQKEGSSFQCRADCQTEE